MSPKLATVPFVEEVMMSRKLKRTQIKRHHWRPLTLDVDVDTDAGVALGIDGLQVVQTGVLPRHPRHVQDRPVRHDPSAIYTRHAVPVVRDLAGVPSGSDVNLTRGALFNVLRVDALRECWWICGTMGCCEFLATNYDLLNQ